MSLGNAAEATRFSACMRAHGMATFPNPDAHGGIQFGPAQGIDPRSPKFRSAGRACRKQLPNGGQPTRAQLTRARRQWLAFSKCMRGHGITDFPDPSRDGPPQIHPSTDLNPNNRQFEAAVKSCQKHLIGVLGGDKFLTDNSFSE